MDEAIKELLYIERQEFPWPRVQQSGKWRCRCRQTKTVTDIAAKLSAYLTPGMSLAKLSRKMNAGISAAHDIIRTNRVPQWDALTKYAEKLDTTPAALVGEVREVVIDEDRDIWIFKDDSARRILENIEPLELVEAFEPLDLMNVPDELLIGLVAGIAKQARDDIEKFERTKPPAETASVQAKTAYSKKEQAAASARNYLDELWSELTGEHGKTRPNRDK